MKTFFVQLITPDKTLFEGEIIRLNVSVDDGGIEILGGHMPSVTAVVPARCEITLPDNTRRVFASAEGVLNIGRDKTVMLSDLLEWEEDLAKALNEREQRISQEHQRRKQSDIEYRLSLVALQRVFAYLSDKNIDS